MHLERRNGEIFVSLHITDPGLLRKRLDSPELLISRHTQSAAQLLHSPTYYQRLAYSPKDPKDVWLVSQGHLFELEEQHRSDSEQI